MPYKALTYINLPVLEDREIWPGIVVPVPTGDFVPKEPGDTITKKELADAGQNEEMVAEMIEYQSLSALDDMDAELHPDHWPVSSDGKTTIAPKPEEATDEGQ